MTRSRFSYIGQTTFRVLVFKSKSVALVASTVSLLSIVLLDGSSSSNKWAMEGSTQKREDCNRKMRLVAVIGATST